MRVLSLSIILYCVAAQAQAQIGGALKSPSGKEPTSQAMAIARVTSDPESGLSDEDLLARLVMSPDVLRSALLNVSKDAAKSPLAEVAGVSAITWGVYNHGQQPAALRSDQRAGVGLVALTATSFDQRIDAEKLLVEIGVALEDRLRRLDTGHASQQRQLQDEETRVAGLADRLAKENELLHTLASIHKVEFDPALRSQKRLRIDSELQGLKAQLLGLKARQDVIEKQIAGLAEVPATSQEDAAIVAELGKSIAARRKIVSLGMTALSRNPGAVTVASIEKAKDELAQAEAELARYRRAAADAASGGRIAQLKTRLDDTAIEIAEIEARGKILDEQLQTASADSSQVTMKRINLEQLQREYRQRSEELTKLRSQLERYVPPGVTVISLSGAK